MHTFSLRILAATSFITLLALFLGPAPALLARTLSVGQGAEYASVASAADDAEPGDTVLVLAGEYGGGQFLIDIRGRADAPIVFRAEPGERVVFRGGTEAWHLSNVAWLHIIGFEFTGQTGNGVNIDDGGTFDTPSHHIIVEDCFFHDMDASGNNDLLKLSGLEDFEIRNCRFLNGSAGGSGADMVGCHNGVFFGNRFENMGSNCIQAKGGTQFIRIERNSFVNGGQRGVNLGGSTGLQFFRPLDAPFEAADIQVYANVFIGAVAPVAFVGSVRVQVVNNTIWKPEKWVTRILQETVDPERFASCGDNVFRNNIVVIDSRVTTDVNIGPNTRPESFVFDHNLWFHTDQAAWSGPDLPVEESGSLVGLDPLLADPDAENFVIDAGSPAAGKGADVGEPTLDFAGAEYNSPRSIGAVEGDPPVTSVRVGRGPSVRQGDPMIRIMPNPVVDACELSYHLARPAKVKLELYNGHGILLREVSEREQSAGRHTCRIQPDVDAGAILVLLTIDGQAFSTRIINLNGGE